jgi:uncharacterized protein YdbL (DUF1318 family)
MAKIHTKWTLLLCFFVSIAACVTVNIYFPAAEVEKAAEKIVDEVYGQDKKAPLDNSSEQSAWHKFLAHLGPQQAWAQDATSISNAAIRGLKQTLAKHHQQLKPFYDQGTLGITRDGYLQIRNISNLSLGKVAMLRKLVQQDNQARKNLYQEVTSALNLDPSQIDRVEKIFARQWKDKASSGWWVQKDDQSWTRK